MRSYVNVSRIVRTAGCCGVNRMIVCGQVKIDRQIARDGAEQVQVDVHRSLAPVLRKLKSDKYQLVALEQTTNSCSLYSFSFARRTALVIGHERKGLTEEILNLVDHVVEIPVFGLPYSHNVATATAMGLYEYCRQFPEG